ncbi:MAG: PAS domain S-box protein [Candidatus Tenebribacter davisii]|jgi:PAS domain S-box-containing protein|nr:PAS domain S-box protein [Candidatus Tenebribacter davisii]
MKLSFIGKIRLLIILIFIVTILQAGIILHLINNANSYMQMKLDLQNTIFISLFIQFILALTIIFYTPVFLHKAFTEIHNIIKDITQGIYTIDIDPDNNKTTIGKEFLIVISLLKDMLKSILNFDTLKKEKIVEHHNRIVSILNLTDDGFAIVDIKGNFVYMNEKVTETFPALHDKSNIIETNFPPEIENNIKKYTLNILKSRTKQEPQQFFVPSLKRHVILNSALIRDASGQPTGAIIAIKNLEKRKQTKEEEL